MKIYRLYWSPTGQKIAEVEASTKRAAVRKAPAPYSRYKGEIYAEEVDVARRAIRSRNVVKFKKGDWVSYSYAIHDPAFKPGYGAPLHPAITGPVTRTSKGKITIDVVSGSREYPRGSSATVPASGAQLLGTMFTGSRRNQAGWPPELPTTSAAQRKAEMREHARWLAAVKAGGSRGRWKPVKYGYSPQGPGGDFYPAKLKKMRNGTYKVYVTPSAAQAMQARMSPGDAAHAEWHAQQEKLAQAHMAAAQRAMQKVWKGRGSRMPGTHPLKIFAGDF